MTTIRLDGETDWEGFSRACRSLVARGVAPEAVDWIVGAGAAASLLSDAAACDARSLEDGAVLELPASLVGAARLAICHAGPDRFALLHRMVSRTASDRRAWHDPLDPDRIRIERLAGDVRREMHKAKAFVRFRPITEADGTVRHVAWFEPVHHVLAAVAPFFVRRFAAMRWAILTPRISVAWDGTALEYGPGASRRDAPPADAGESLWLAYYRSIFNPARLKVATMVREMPVRYWANLPEASAIAGLVATATERAAGWSRRRRWGADADAVPSMRRRCPRETDVPTCRRGSAAESNRRGKRATCCGSPATGRREGARPMMIRWRNGADGRNLQVDAGRAAWHCSNVPVSPEYWLRPDWL